MRRRQHRLLASQTHGFHVATMNAALFNDNAQKAMEIARDAIGTAWGAVKESAANQTRVFMRGSGHPMPPPAVDSPGLGLGAQWNKNTLPKISKGKASLDPSLRCTEIAEDGRFLDEKVYFKKSELIAKVRHASD